MDRQPLSRSRGLVTGVWKFLLRDETDRRVNRRRDVLGSRSVPVGHRDGFGTSAPLRGPLSSPTS